MLLRIALLALLAFITSVSVARVVGAASLVVASKDSLNPERADYVCDGADDQVEIQQAIDSLPAAGGMVALLEGTFNFRDDVRITKPNVTIRGVGKSTVLKHDPTQWTALTEDAEKGADTITVEDAGQFRVGHLIGITDSDINPPPGRGEPKGFYRTYYVRSALHVIKDIHGNTLALDRGLGSTVTTARGARAAPAWVMIRAYDTADLQLSDFSIDGNRANVARVYGGGAYSNHASPYPSIGDKNLPRVLIDKVHHGEEPTSAIYMESAHNSRFQNLYLHDIAMSGMFLINCNYVLVQGNTIRNYGLKGYVDCFGDYTQIIGNVVENSMHEYGIIVYHGASNYAIVANNIVRNTAGTAICINQARRTVVTGNIAYGSGTGISTVGQEGTISGNYIEKCGAGIWVHTLKAESYPITITGNSIRGCDEGFTINKACNVSLVANSVADTKRTALAADAAVNGLIVSNNQFFNAVSGEHPAVHLAGDGHLLFGNKIRNFKQGVVLESTAEGNVVERNQFVNVQEPISDRGQGNVKEKNW